MTILLLILFFDNGEICDFDAEKINSCIRGSIDLVPLKVQKNSM